jgi:TolB-like protein
MELARLERRAGDLNPASRRLYDTFLLYGLPYRAEAEELRAQIAEQQGDSAAAIRAYQNFTELWKDADPELQPRWRRRGRRWRGWSDEPAIGRMVGLANGGVDHHPAIRLSAIRPSALFAQCPDGSAPPCRVTATTPARVAIDSNAVAILPFRVSGPPETQYLREGMLDLLSVALDGFAGWRVIQPRAFLRQVNTNAGPMNVPQASRLAREAGAGTFVLGNVVALGPELRVQAELYESARGTSLASVRARGSVALPAPVADSIAGGLARRRLALHGGATRHALEEYTTTSPVALQAYLVAEQLARHARWQEAAESLTVAIGLDSTFALASYALYRAITWGNSGPIFQRASDRAITPYSIEDVIQAAIRHLDRAPPRQRRLLEFAAATNRAESLRLADGLTQDYPDDADAWLERGDAYFHVGLQSGESPTRSLESLQRAIALDPLVPGPISTWSAPQHAGRQRRAWQALRQLRAMAPTGSHAGPGLGHARRLAPGGSATLPTKPRDRDHHWALHAADPGPNASASGRLGRFVCCSRERA